MGYNGNNRGRTHRWSGVGDMRHYKWGLNITAKAMVAPFAIMAALVEMENSVSEDTTQQPEATFESKNNTPIAILKSCEDKTDNLHKLYRKVAFVRRDISNIKRTILFLKLDILHRKESKRIINLLTYLIQRRERLINPICLFDYNVGEPIKSSAITGRVTIHSAPQNSNTFNLGCLCKKDTKIFHKYIETVDTLSIRTRKWQILFFSNALLLESKKGFAIVPYENIRWTKQDVINHGLTNTHGYEVYYQTWYHARVDGGPDRRFKENHPIYTIRRYQLSLKFLLANNIIYLIFDNNNDAKNIGNIISQKASSKILGNDVKLLSWSEQRKKTRNEIVLSVLSFIIILCTSLLLEWLFKVPSWELWNGFLIFPLVAAVGALFVVTLPVGLESWLLGTLHRSLLKKPKIIIPVLAGVAVALAIITYVIGAKFLENVGFFSGYTHFYYDWSEIINLVLWCLISFGIGYFIYYLTKKNTVE